MLNIKKSMVALAIMSAAALPMTSFATVDNFGDISGSTVSGNYSSFVVLGAGSDRGDTFNFTLNSPFTDLSITTQQFAGLNVGRSYFSLIKDGNEIESFDLAPFILDRTDIYTFENLTNGNYTLSFIPSNILGINVAGTVTISATAVPEPETNALMLVGLGLIGFIARRKFA